MNKTRLILIICMALSLAGLVVSIVCRDDDSWKSSDKSEEVFRKALDTIDSILIANDRKPEEYRKFKEAAALLTPRELEEEAYRCVSTNDALGKEEYYYRALIERYNKDLPVKDKVSIIKILNNLGCYYNEKNNPAAAYIILKTGYEMAKAFDKPGQAIPAFLCNMASVFKMYGDNQKAESMYSQAVNIAYSPGFKPGDARKLEAARIHTHVEYLHFLWTIDKLDSTVVRKGFFNRTIPNSTYDYGTYAGYLDEAAKKYIARDYKASEVYLDSAATSLKFLYNEVQYNGICRLLMADAMFHAKDYGKMRQHLDSAGNSIRTSNLTFLLPDLYKGYETYYRNIGDTVKAGEVHSRGLAVCDSLFSNRNYAALRDVHDEWDQAWTDLKVEHVQKTSIWIILSGICLTLSVAGLALTFLTRRKRNTVSNEPETAESQHTEQPVEGPDKETEDMETDSAGADNAEVQEGLDEESDESLKALYDEICKAVENNPGIYDVDFSINTLAAQMGVNSRRISRAVNICSGGNFSTFLSTYRVREACRILDSAATPLERPTMDALAQMVGYKSRAHLSRVFKAVTGVSPTDYISRHNNGTEV